MKLLARRRILVGIILTGLVSALCESKSNAQQQINNPQLKTASRAFQLFSQGVSSGEFQPLLDMLTDDCAARFPVAKFRSEGSGKRAIAAYFRFVGQELKVRAKVTTVSITSNANTVGFEFQVKGTAAGKPTNTQNVVFFDVRGDKIIGFREYFGN